MLGKSKQEDEEHGQDWQKAVLSIDQDQSSTRPWSHAHIRPESHHSRVTSLPRPESGFRPKRSPRELEEGDTDIDGLLSMSMKKA
jgi:hypothetical protein